MLGAFEESLKDLGQTEQHFYDQNIMLPRVFRVLDVQMYFFKALELSSNSSKIRDLRIIIIMVKPDFSEKSLRRFLRFAFEIFFVDVLSEII